MKKIKLILFVAMMVFQIMLLTSCEETPYRPTYSYTDQSATAKTTEPEDTGLDIPTRPNDEVYFKNGFCGCQNGKAITLGNCDNFCSSKNVSDPTLFLEVEVSEKISAREDLGSFYNWCKKELVDPNTGEAVASGVNCVMKATSESGATGELSFVKDVTPGTKNLEINISTLDDNVTYRLELVEITSQATSKTIQVRKYAAPPVEPIGGPLWTVPVHQYSCLWRQFSTQDSSIFYEDLQRVHYYFTNETRPEPLEAGIVDIYCHDINTYGATPINNPLLEETPGSFTLWNKWDPRFYIDPTVEGSDVLRVNEILRQKVEDQGYSMTQAPNLFFKFQWPNGPQVSANNSSSSGSSSSSSSQQNSDPEDLGWYMTPWIDQTTFKAYCPKQAHYYSSNQLFVAMRDVIGVDTEGLYIAKQEGVDDYILIKESLLKQIWFYIENNQHIEPNNDTVTGQQIQFYWPASTESPFIRKSHQQVFTIKAASEIGPSVSNNQQGGNGTSSSYPPHDKRLGCIPQL